MLDHCVEDPEPPKRGEVLWVILLQRQAVHYYGLRREWYFNWTICVGDLQVKIKEAKSKQQLFSQ